MIASTKKCIAVWLLPQNSRSSAKISQRSCSAKVWDDIDKGGWARSIQDMDHCPNATCVAAWLDSTQGLIPIQILNSNSSLSLINIEIVSQHVMLAVPLKNNHRLHLQCMCILYAIGTTLQFLFCFSSLWTLDFLILDTRLDDGIVTPEVSTLNEWAVGRVVLWTVKILSNHLHYLILKLKLIIWIPESGLMMTKINSNTHWIATVYYSLIVNNIFNVSSLSKVVA